MKYFNLSILLLLLSNLLFAQSGVNVPYTEFPAGVITPIINQSTTAPLTLTNKSKSINGLSYHEYVNGTFKMPSYYTSENQTRDDKFVYVDRNGFGPSLTLYYLPYVKVFKRYTFVNAGMFNQDDHYLRENWLQFSNEVNGSLIAGVNNYSLVPALGGTYEIKLKYKLISTYRSRNSNKWSESSFTSLSAPPNVGSYECDSREEKAWETADAFKIVTKEAKWVNIDESLLILRLCNEGQTINLYDYFSDKTGVTFTFAGNDLPNEFLNIGTVGSGEYKIKASKSYENGIFSEEIDLKIVDLPSDVVTSTASNICEGTTATITAAQAPQGTVYTYKWYRNNTIMNGLNSSTIDVGETGSYHAEISADGSSCVTKTKTVSVNVNNAPKPTINLQGSSIICDGESVVLIPSESGVAYRWLDENSNEVGTTQVLTVSNAGSYKVFVTYQNGCTAESAPVTITVKPNPKPILTASGPITFCEGGSVSLVASLPDGFIAQNFKWSNGGSGQTLTVTESGTYYVTVTNSQGCSNASVPIQVTVHPNPKPEIIPNGALEFCEGGEVILTAPTAKSYLWNNGETSQSITVTKGGSFSVKTFTNDGCSNESTLVTVKVNPNVKPIIKAQSATEFCEGESVVLQVTNAQPNTTYTWSNGTTGLQTNISTSQSVYVIASNQSGCSQNSEVIDVQVNPIQKPVISTSGVTEFCDGGSVVLNVVNATGADEIRWSNGGVGTSITVTSSGNYYATIVRGDCERSSDEIEVKVIPNVLPIIQAQGPTTVCEGESVVLQVTNPQPNTTYTWNNGNTGPTITTTTSGTYFVTSSNFSGCSRTGEPIQVTVNPIQKPLISLSSSPTFCDGGSITLTVTNSSGADEIRWSNGETGSSIVVSASGNYYAVLIKGNCERISDEVTINVTPNIKPIIEIIGATTICEGQSATIQVSNPQPSTTYTWNTGETGTHIIAKTTGNYFVTSQNTGNCSRTSEIMSLTVMPIAKPTISIDNESTICQGDSIVMTINETASSYRWNTGENTKSIVVKSGGTYIAYLSNGQCERASDPLTVTVNPNTKIVVSELGSTTFCEGDSLVLSVINSGKYIWNTGETTRSITIKKSGKYFVSVTNDFNCTSTSQVYDVKVHPIPKPTVSITGNTTICEGESIILTINESASSYRWNTGETTKSIVVKTGGNYIGYISNIQGCERSTEPININVQPNPIPKININGLTEFCEPDSTILYVTPIAGITYTWSNGKTGSSIVVKNTGNYYVTSTTKTGCTAVSELIDIKVYPLPKPTIYAAGNTEFCQGDSVSLTINETASSYRWSTGETTKSIVVKTGGVYTAFIKNEFDCERASDPMKIIVHPNLKPTISFVSLTICEGDSVKLSASNGTAYLWSNGATTKDIYVSSPGKYAVTVTNTYGCSNLSDSVTVQILSNPKPTITSANGTDICEGETTVLTASEAQFYIWSNGETTRSIVVSNSGNYSVTVTNQSGCTRKSADFVLKVHQPYSLKLIPDQQICGNGDKLNLDEFNPNPIGGVYQGEGVTFNIFDPKQVSAGTYKIKYTYTTEFGCISSIDFGIEVAVIDSLNPGEDIEVCLNSGDILLQVDGLPVGVKFEGKGVVGNLFKPEQAGVGIHEITYSYTNKFGCISIARRLFTVTPQPTKPVVTGNMIVCNNSSITLEAKSSILNNKFITYNWYREGEQEPFAVGAQIRYVVTKNEKIYVEALSNKGCSSEERTEIIISTYTPEIRLTASSNTIAQGSSVQFKLQDLPGSNPSIRWEYDFGDGFKSQERDPLHYYNKSGVYTVSVRAYSEQGCVAELSEINYITVTENPIVVEPPHTGQEPIEDNNPFYATIVYPNPIKQGDVVTLRTYNAKSGNARATLQVYTIAGTPILNQQLDLEPGQNEISIENLEKLTANTYFMFVITFEDGRKEAIKVLVL